MYVAYNQSTDHTDGYNQSTDHTICMALEITLYSDLCHQNVVYQHSFA
jgi:hypothetical protein